VVSMTRWQQVVGFEPGNPVQRTREPFAYQPSNNGGSSPGITSIYFNPVDAGGVNLIQGGASPPSGISGALSGMPGGTWGTVGLVLGLAAGAIAGWKLGR
jgi:hypothetical protein